MMAGRDKIPTYVYLEIAFCGCPEQNALLYDFDLSSGGFDC